MLDFVWCTQLSSYMRWEKEALFDNLLSQQHFCQKLSKLEMWANAQRDGRPAKYRWRPLFNAAKFG